MKNFTIFKKEYFDLFTDYGYGVATLAHIMYGLGYDLNNMNSEEAKPKCVEAVKQLLENDIIHVTLLNNELYNKKTLTNLEKENILKKIKEIWSYKQPNFESIINFEYQNWYLSKIKEEGINIKTDWKWFSEEFIPNMKKWIEENRPKR
ncbi:hypothetical protein ACQY1Q_17220 [Tenacibaculum sp. TC6]|uniref:hypothetical protein n=1 Tax=Tenacibaculum sp. TC6 TaxID=3423223 RepID=UPI003D368959